MDLGGEGVSVYAEAKGEYTRQLCQYIVPALQSFYLDLLEEAKAKEPEAKKILLKFQQLLEEIPEWNVDKVQRETTALNRATNCDYLEELLTAVFIAHTKVLSAIRLSTKQKKLQITIPKLDHFLHRTLTECARLLWSNTYLFSPGAPAIERQKNLRQIETFLNDGVLQGIRTMLPVKSILKEYLRDDGDDEEEEATPNTPAVAAAEVEEEDELPADAPTEVTAEVAAEVAAEVTDSPAEVASAPPAPATPPTTPVEPEAVATAAPPEQPTIVVNTAGPQVSFTGMNQIIVPDEPEQSEMQPMGDEDDEIVEGEIQILDTAPEGVDDFEDLSEGGALDGPLPMEFEELA
jgi:hypothetical protein